MLANSLAIFDKNKEIMAINLFFLFAPIMFVIGPAIFDLFTTISCLCFFIYFILKKKIKTNINFITFLIIIFAYINFLSIFVSNNIDSTYRSLAFLRYIIIFMSVTSIFYHHNNNSLLYFFFSSNILVFIIVLNQIYQLFTGFDILGNPAVVYRLSGFYGDELIVGQVLFILSLPSIYFSFFIKNKNISNYYLILTLTIVLIGIFLSGQRSALINCTVSIIIFFYFFRYKLKISIFKIITFLVSLLFFCIFFVKNFNERFIQTTLNQLSNFFDTSYFAYFESSVIVWLKNPILGVGLKNYRNECTNELFISGYSSVPCTTHPHNIYLEILSELGIIGFLIFLTLFIFYFMTVLKNILEDSNANKYSIIPFFVVTIPIIFSIIPSGSFFTNAHSVPFWLYFSIALSILNYKDKKISI